jgi:helicase
MFYQIFKVLKYNPCSFMKHLILLEESQFKPTGEGKAFYKETPLGEKKVLELIKVEDTDLNLPYKVLNPLQSLFYRYYRSGNALVSAPTSAGKTGIAFIFFHNRSGRLVYTAPTKALVYEKARELRSLFGKVDIRTGDVIEEFKPVRSRVVVSTYENLALALRNKSPWSEDISAVVIDEIHALLGNRGQVVEEIITELLLKEIDILALSATIPGASKLANWLQAEIFIESRWRPVPLERKIIPLTKFREFINPKELDEDIRSDERMALKLLTAIFELSERDEKVIVFVPKKTIGWKILEYASREKIEIANKTVPFETEREGFELAFHNADVPKEEREEIEKAFREGELNKLIATQTLAYGVNLPADKVIIAVRGYYDRNERKHKIFPDVLDILQEEGRAGRFGIKEKGFSFILPYGSAPEKVETSLKRALSRDFEPFISQELKGESFLEKLSPEAFNRLSLFLLVAIFHEGERFKEFLKKSYSLSKLYNHPLVDQLVDWLKENLYLEGNFKLTEKGQFCLKSGIPPLNFEEFLRRKMLSLEPITVYRPLLYTKRFDGLYFFLKRNPRFEKDREKVISLLLPCGVECLKDNTDQLLFYIKGYTFYYPNISNPPGDFSYLGSDVLHLLRTLLDLRKLGEVKETNEDLLRLAHSLKYGLEFQYAPLGGIKGIGHIRANLLKENLITEQVEKVNFNQKVESLLDSYYDTEVLKESLKDLLVELRRLSPSKAKVEATRTVKVLEKNRNSLLVDDRILTTFGLFLFDRAALRMKREELLEKILEGD